MNPPRDRRVGAAGARGLGALCGLMLVSWAAPAWAQDWQAGAQTVHELMRTETQVAAPVAAPAPSPSPSPPRLMALYGTAGQLTAVVDVNGVRMEYRPGASLPYAGAGAGAEYRLVRIVDTCVVLRRGSQGRLHTTCYVPHLPTPPAQPTPLSASNQSALSAPLPLSGGMP